LDNGLSLENKIRLIKNRKEGIPCIPGSDGN